MSVTLTCMEPAAEPSRQSQMDDPCRELCTSFCYVSLTLCTFCWMCTFASCQRHGAESIQCNPPPLATREALHFDLRHRLASTHFGMRHEYRRSDDVASFPPFHLESVLIYAKMYVLHSVQGTSISLGPFGQAIHADARRAELTMCIFRSNVTAVLPASMSREAN